MGIGKVQQTEQNPVYISGIKKQAEGLKGTDKKQAGKGKSIFAYMGASKTKQDSVAEKKELAAQKARKLIFDQVANDEKIDEEMEEHFQKQEEYDQLRGEANQQIRSINEREKELQQEYGVSDDSEEQQDLELLKKARKCPEALTEEENERLKNMPSLTEYQKATFREEGKKDYWELELKKANKGMTGEVMTVSAMKQELLKSSPMLEAQKEAKSVLEQASKEAIAGMMEEVKEKIDKEREEAEEKIKDKEEEEEEAEKLEERKEEAERENTQPKIDSFQSLLMEESDGGTDIRKEFKNLAEELKLLEEELKGIHIDEAL